MKIGNITLKLKCIVLDEGELENIIMVLDYVKANGWKIPEHIVQAAIISEKLKDANTDRKGGDNEKLQN